VTHSVISNPDPPAGGGGEKTLSERKSKARERDSSTELALSPSTPLRRNSIEVVGMTVKR